MSEDLTPRQKGKLAATLGSDLPTVPSDLRDTPEGVATYVRTTAEGHAHGYRLGAAGLETIAPRAGERVGAHLLAAAKALDVLVADLDAYMAKRKAPPAVHDGPGDLVVGVMGDTLFVKSAVEIPPEDLEAFRHRLLEALRILGHEPSDFVAVHGGLDLRVIVSPAAGPRSGSGIIDDG